MTLCSYLAVRFFPGLVFFSLCLQPTCGEILQGPVSQLAPVNSTVTFFCHARGDLITWYINGDIVDYRNEGSLRQRGFTFVDINSPPEVYKTMSVSASLQNNNTNITCGATLGQGNRSPTANLLVAGVPSIPHPRVTILNKTTLQISWERPFTMGRFTVRNYSLGVVNTSSDSVVMSRNILPRNATVYTELLSTPHATQTCSQLQISLTAANVIGESGVGTTTGGFPVIPGPLESLESEVTFQSDGTPQVEIHFILPYICSYQDANYTIEVSEKSTNISSEEGSFQYVDRDVRIKIQSGLRPNWNYTATIIVKTVAWSINSSISFNTTFTLPTAGTQGTLGSVSPFTGGTEDTSGSLPPAIGGTPGSSLPLPPATGVKTQQDGSNTTVIIGAAVGSIGLILLVAICVVAACIIIQRKRGKDVRTDYNVESVQKACSSMVPNPLYESDNHVYEEIHQTQQQSPSQNRDSGYVDIILNIASRIKLKSEKNTTPQKAAGYENVDLKVPTSTDDDYTLMNPVGTIRSTQQTKEGVGEERHQPCNSVPFETDTNRYIIS